MKNTIDQVVRSEQQYRAVASGIAESFYHLFNKIKKTPIRVKTEIFTFNIKVELMDVSMVLDEYPDENRMAEAVYDQCEIKNLRTNVAKYLSLSVNSNDRETIAEFLVCHNEELVYFLNEKIYDFKQYKSKLKKVSEQIDEICWEISELIKIWKYNQKDLFKAISEEYYEMRENGEKS